MSVEPSALSWPPALGAGDELSARTFRVREQWSDFVVEEVVDELPELALSDAPHSLLLIEKAGLTTPAVASELARRQGCAVMDVGRFGLKDRHAVTRQWLSVPRGTEPVRPGDGAGDVGGAHWRVLDVRGGRRKLRPGGHAGNRFTLVLRGLSLDAWLEARVAQLREQGVPNYFGPQRFGHRGSNTTRALAWLADSQQRGAGRGRRARTHRDKRSRHLSVLRALFFNEVLALRVSDGTWHKPVSGDVFVDSEPTGPLWGRGRSQVSADAQAIEQAALAPWWLACLALEYAGVDQGRRALRFVPSDLRAEAVLESLSSQAVRLTFTAPPGSYATALLAELGQAIEPSRTDSAEPVMAARTNPGRAA